MPSNGATKVRGRSRLLLPYFDVSEGAQSSRLGLGHWVLVGIVSSSQMNGGHNRVPGGLVASQGTPMPPPDKFDWFVVAAALLVILVVAAVVVT